jgi:hypothetical protein
MRSLQVLSWSRNSTHFIEPEGSLPHSQVPATCPYPEPDQSSPCTPSHFFKIYFNIILSSTPSSSNWPLSLRSPYKNPLSISPVYHTCHMPCPSHSSRFDHPKNICLGKHIIKPLVTYFSLFYYLVPLRPRHIFQ